MADEIKDLAQASVEATLSGGQSVSQGDMSVSQANLRDAHEILKEEENKEASRNGRRPLFRNVNMSGVI